jgi:hypothetical protein
MDLKWTPWWTLKSTGRRGGGLCGPSALSRALGVRTRGRSNALFTRALTPNPLGPLFGPPAPGTVCDFRSSGELHIDAGFRRLRMVYSPGERAYHDQEETMKATARQRIIQELETNPEGLSKSALRERIGGNGGAFRRLIQSMIDRDEIVVTRVDRPDCGPTNIHTLGESRPKANGRAAA